MVTENDEFSLIGFNEHTLLTWNVEGKNPNTKKPKIERLKHAMLGIIDEAGEIAKIFKKMVGYNKDFDKTGLIEELGDFLYYLVRIADETGYLSNNEQFIYLFERTINTKKVDIKNEMSATDYCVELTKSVYLINSSVNSYDLPDHLISVIKTLKRLALYSGTNMIEVAKANERKLRERHGKTYNPNNLEDRNTEEERSAIENQT